MNVLFLVPAMFFCKKKLEDRSRAGLMDLIGAQAPVERNHPEIEREGNDGGALLECEAAHGKGDAPRQHGGEQNHAVFQIHGHFSAVWLQARPVVSRPTRVVVRKAPMCRASDSTMFSKLSSRPDFSNRAEYEEDMATMAATLNMEMMPPPFSMESSASGGL